MAGENENALQEITAAVTELREIVDKKSLSPQGLEKINSLDLVKIEKINTFLDEQEEKNQKYQTEKAAAEGAAEEQKGRLDVLEAELARKIAEPGGEKNYKESEEYKALHTFFQEGDRAGTEEKALLRTDSDTAGGYLVTAEMDNVITKAITEISPIRSVARVRTVSKKSLEMAVRKNILAAQYEGEAEEGTEDTSDYGNETLTAFRQTVTVPISLDMLMDSSFDMEAEIMGDANEAFALGEGTNFVLGTGVKRPEGFLVNAEVVAGALQGVAASGTIDATDVILLTGELKTGYNPVYAFNRKTLAGLRTEKSAADGVFLWQPGMNGPVANTISGFPYIIANDMPDVASTTLSVAFGDFRRGYTIIDRTGISVIRDEVTRKKKAIVEFTIHRWNYGQVTLPEAITLLKTAT